MVQAYTPGFFAVFFFLADLAVDGLGLKRRPATADETRPNSQNDGQFSTKCSVRRLSERGWSSISDNNLRCLAPDLE